MSTPISQRCHIHLPIIDSAGVVFPYASITLNDAATGTILATDVYVQPEGGNPISFPLFTDPAVVDLWLDEPARVQIVAEVSDNTRIVLDGVDILPPAAKMVTAPRRLAITGADNIAATAVLMYGDDGQAVFRITDPVGTHQHEGDSAGSVVLTREPPTDFNPYQTWVGYQAGRNAAPSSSGSSAYGASADVDGASSTVMGQGAIVQQAGGGVRGSMATFLSSQDGDAASGSTVAGGGNLTALARNMAVVGALNTATSAATNSVLLGSGNSVGSSGVVKIGVNHGTASGAGSNHTVVGPANSAQTSRLPWSAGNQTPFAIGGSAISLAGDPSDQVSATDAFCGVGTLAMGENDTTWDPSVGLIQGNAVTRTALRAEGDVVVNGQRTWSNASTTLGFYGAMGVARQNITQDSTYASTLLNSVLQALSKMGLVYTTDVPQVLESGHHADGTRLEFAETGQALQWKLPTASPDYRATNDFTVASNKITLNSASAPFPTRGVAGIYSASLSNVICQGQFVYNATYAAGTNVITNSGFETDTTGWQAWDGGVVIARDTTKARYGDASMKITPPGTSDYARAAAVFTTTPGTQANFSVWVYSAYSHKVGMIIDWFDASWNYLGNNGAFVAADVPLNTWTRVNVGGTAPLLTANVGFTVGYIDQTGASIPATHTLNIDAAMLQFGVTALPPFVDNSGYHPDDYVTGLMVRALHEKSTVGGQPAATLKGYLVGRKNVYSMAGNAITGTVATHSTPVATGQILQADCNGTSIIIRANGTQISTFTDSTWNNQVKYGYRVTETTKASDFLVLPFGF